MRVSEGDMAPTFTLTDHDGGQWSLEDQRGRPVILYFFPKADTPGCTIQAQDVRDNWSRFTDLGVEVVGISSDTPEDMKAFAGKYDLPHRLLGDPEREAIDAYDVWTVKEFKGRPFEGAGRSSVVIDAEGRVAAVFDPIEADRQSEQTLAIAERLTGGQASPVSGG